MNPSLRKGIAAIVAAGLILCLTIIWISWPGVHSPARPVAATAKAPTSADKSTLPLYIIEFPDVLSLEMSKVSAKSSYRIRLNDVLDIEIGEKLFAGRCVESDGRISLGDGVGSMEIVDLTLAEAADAVAQQIAATNPDRHVAVRFNAEFIKRQVAGERLVQRDGNIQLGSFGHVSVDASTLAQAKAAVEARLAEFLEAPRVTINVEKSESKFYFVVVQEAGGDSITRTPITGNETVLDAVAQCGARLKPSGQNVWIERPQPGNTEDEILSVDFSEASPDGSKTTMTNYQLLPGDRVFVAEVIDTPTEVWAWMGKIVESISLSLSP